MSERNEAGQEQHRILPIHAACMNGNKSTLKSLINAVPRRLLEFKDPLGRTPLILTVSRNFVDCGSVLLKAGVNVDNTDNSGQTALHIAACKGFHQFVKLLLSFKASWMQRDYFGVTALHMAAIHPNIKGLSAIVKYLKPAEIDIQDSTSKTPLHWSAAYACTENTKVLLSQGANTCIPDEDGKTPLHWAVTNPSPEALACVKTLLKEQPNLINWQDYSGRSPLHIAVACGSEEVLYYLASIENCDVDILDNSICTPLHCAAKRGFSEKADILLKKRASHLSLDINGATALHYAAYNNQDETVQVFCSKNYTKDEPDKFGRSALIWAAIQNSNEALVMLATYTHDISSADRNGYNALHAAAIYGHVTAIEFLVRAGLSIDLVDKFGMTPFLKACEFGRSKAAQTLLNCGASINAVDAKNRSALHWCARGGHAYLSQILIRKEVDYNIQDDFRMTPLHYASSTGDFINCTCVLVESGADPNLTDIDGKTPLHCAVLNERIGITRYLCDHDANVNAMFLIDDWYTPLDCALFKGNNEIANLLKRYGGVRACDIKECAAIVIQKWFRKNRKIDHCNSQEDLMKPNTMLNAFCLSSDEDCIPVSKLSPGFIDAISSMEHHICNGCFHKIICNHVCKTESCHLIENVEDKAAIVIQRIWRKYILKKQFARMRNEIAAEYSSKIERILDEELWRDKLQKFYDSLN